jgi:hypothetical protein
MRWRCIVAIPPFTINIHCTISEPRRPCILRGNFPIRIPKPFRSQYTRDRSRYTEGIPSAQFSPPRMTAALIQTD